MSFSRLPSLVSRFIMSSRSRAEILLQKQFEYAKRSLETVDNSVVPTVLENHKICGTCEQERIYIAADIRCEICLSPSAIRKHGYRSLCCGKLICGGCFATAYVGPAGEKKCVLGCGHKKSYNNKARHLKIRLREKIHRHEIPQSRMFQPLPAEVLLASNNYKNPTRLEKCPINDCGDYINIIDMKTHVKEVHLLNETLCSCGASVALEDFPRHLGDALHGFPNVHQPFSPSALALEICGICSEEWPLYLFPLHIKQRHSKDRVLDTPLNDPKVTRPIAKLAPTPDEYKSKLLGESSSATQDKTKVSIPPCEPSPASLISVPAPVLQFSSTFGVRQTAPYSVVTEPISPQPWDFFSLKPPPLFASKPFQPLERREAMRKPADGQEIVRQARLARFLSIPPSPESIDSTQGLVPVFSSMTFKSPARIPPAATLASVCRRLFKEPDIPAPLSKPASQSEPASASHSGPEQEPASASLSAIASLPEPESVPAISPVEAPLIIEPISLSGPLPAPKKSRAKKPKKRAAKKAAVKKPAVHKRRAGCPCVLCFDYIPEPSCSKVVEPDCLSTESVDPSDPMYRFMISPDPNGLQIEIMSNSSSVREWDSNRDAATIIMEDVVDPMDVEESAFSPRPIDPVVLLSHRSIDPDAALPPLLPSAPDRKRKYDLGSYEELQAKRKCTHLRI